MSPDWVIEPIDVSDDGVFGSLAGLPCDWPEQFRLDGLEEGFDHRVASRQPQRRKGYIGPKSSNAAKE